jgi:hypothetical protein
MKLPTTFSISFPRRSTRRDEGMSLARAYKHWYLVLGACAIALICVVGVAYDAYTDTLIERPIVTDPIAGARYRHDDVSAALKRYDERRARQGAYTTQSPPPPQVETEVAPHTPIATTTPPEVE